MEQPLQPPNLQSEMERGRQATELLEHPLLQEALRVLRQDFQTAWVNSPARDSEGRERLWHLVKLVDRFESYLTEVVTTGRMAVQEIEQRTLMQKLKDGIASFSD